MWDSRGLSKLRRSIRRFAANSAISTPSSDLIERMWARQQVFSHFGQFMIVVWGVVFLATGLAEEASGRISWVWWGFVLEKCCYVHASYRWLTTNDAIAMLRASQQSGDPLDILPPLFHSIYGFVDFMSLLLFANLGCQALQQGAHQEAVGRKKQ